MWFAAEPGVERVQTLGPTVGEGLSMIVSSGLDGTSTTCGSTWLEVKLSSVVVVVLSLNLDRKAQLTCPKSDELRRKAEAPTGASPDERARRLVFPGKEVIEYELGESEKMVGRRGLALAAWGIERANGNEFLRSDTALRSTGSGLLSSSATTGGFGKRYDVRSGGGGESSSDENAEPSFECESDGVCDGACSETSAIWSKAEMPYERPRWDSSLESRLWSEGRCGL